MRSPLPLASDFAWRIRRPIPRGCKRKVAPCSTPSCGVCATKLVSAAFDLNNGSTVHMCFPKQVVFVRNAASFSLVPASTFNVSNDTSTQVGTRSSVQLAYTLVFIALHTAKDDMAYPRAVQQLFRCTGGVRGENLRPLGMTVGFDDALLVGDVRAYSVVSGRVSPHAMGSIAEHHV
mmetsp:Transcript_9710/g.30810  ORF Transcript_9710/g.30810 Transcript_9710/m.30810 type:complete len:177 (-) Transcript_9710:823-1353(-)